MSLSNSSAFRSLPSIDQLLRTEAAEKLCESIGLRQLTAIARRITEEMRQEIRTQQTGASTKEVLLQEATERLLLFYNNEGNDRIRRVINATGVILHTNLGRAPLSDAARKAVAEEAAGYCTLEYDLTTGSRGGRARRAEQLLVELTGAESALVVNNCASAALLILSVLARDGETIVSRGELVEIGGDFRVPDVMANSGTRMIEVGSTNRTRIDDYRRALSEKTRVLMRVHPSNFRIVGFTDSPSLSELSSLAHEAGVLSYEDAGSGAVADLSKYGLGDEPVIRESIEAGADVVSFSGDKLLGAGQAGLIVGKKEIVDQLRRHSLYRALRADKLSLAALEVTLEAHRGNTPEDVPTLRMLGLSKESIESRANRLIEQITAGPPLETLTAKVISGESAVGGGSGPAVHPQTALIALSHSSLTADRLEERLRFSSVPIITRIADGLVLIDLRTVEPRDETLVVQALRSIT